MDDEVRMVDDEDMRFKLLSSSRRRSILGMLHEVGGSIDIKDLTDRLTASESGKSVDELTTQERKRVYTSFYQNHLPLLEKAGVVDYEHDTRTIRLTDQFDQFGPYLGLEARPSTVHRYYLALAGTCAVFYAVVVLDVPPFDAISELVAGLLILLAITALAVGLSIRGRSPSMSLRTR